MWRVRNRPSLQDQGFSLIGLLVVVIIVGILTAIAIPVFNNQRARAHVASVQSDLRSFNTAAETSIAATGQLPATADAWRAHGASVSKDNKFKVFVRTAHPAGYMVYATNVNTNVVYLISSESALTPTRVTFTSSTTWGGNIDNAIASGDNGVGTNYLTDLVPWMDTQPVDMG